MMPLSSSELISLPKKIEERESAKKSAEKVVLEGANDGAKYTKRRFKQG
jgi:hypothetical protein